MLPNKKVLLVNFEKISSDKLAFQITETHYISCLYYVIRGIIYHNHDGISWKEMNQIRQQPEESIGKTTRITMTLLPL